MNRSPLVQRVVLSIAVVCAGAVTTGAAAQKATTTPATGFLAYAAAIYGGSCDGLSDEPVYRLGTVAPRPGAERLFERQADRDQEPLTIEDLPTLTLTTTIDATLGDVTGGSYAIAATDDRANPRTVVACGVVAGNAGGGRIIVDLRPVQSSGVAGTALLREPAGGLEIDIELYKDVVYVTSVPVDLQPNAIVAPSHVLPGPVQFLVFNQRVEGASTLVLTGEGIQGSRAIEVESGRHGYLSVVLPPGRYRLACPECGEGEQTVARTIVVESGATPGP